MEEVKTAITTTAVNPLREKLGAKSPAETIKWLNLLVYGEPGAGKTHLIGTAQDHPSTSPVLVLDVEGGTTTLRDRSDIDVVSIRSIQELKNVINTFADENNGHYKTLAIDSLTELQKLDMRDIMRELVERRPDLDPDVPSQREWGKSIEHIRRIVRAVRDLDCNTIITAHSHTLIDSNNATTYFPSLPGKLRGEVPGFLDIVGYLYASLEEGEYVRYLQVAKTQRVVAKDRTSRIGEGGVLQSPTIPIIFEQISSKPKAKKE